MSAYIVTGAPGTGKSTLLGHLGRDYRTVAEPARELIAEHRAAGAELPGTDDFISMILERSIRNHALAADSGDEVIFFDRGMPDCVAYAVYLGADPVPSREAVVRFRYEPTVFLAPPWEDIYTTDEERRMTFDQVGSFHDTLADAYAATDYQLVELPRSTVAERAAFVRNHLRL